MIRISRTHAVLAIGLCGLVGLAACDDSQKRSADQEAERRQPPVRTGNVGETMAGERVIPKLPTPNDRLLLAIRSGDQRTAEKALAEGATLDPEAPVLVPATRGTGDVELLRWLVGLGAGVDVPDSAGRTPLSWAAGVGDEAKLDYLLERGADPHTIDRLGRTALHYGVFSGRAAIVGRLLDAAAVIDTQDSLGSTPLMYACAKNEAAIIQLLRDRGARSDLEDNLGRTAAERAHGDSNPCAP